MGRERTGDCFKTTAKMQTDTMPTWELVHGIPTGRSGAAEGIRYPHAWLESPCGKIVFDPNLHEKGIDPFIDLQTYYDLGNIKWTVRYPIGSTRKRLNETEHWGPWHQKLIDLGKEIR